MRRGYGRLAAVIALTAPAPALATVPVIGCPAVGQSGPIPAPTRLGPAPAVARGLEGTLAFYMGPYSVVAVLAPRGWHCLESYGSGGAQLFVTPAPITADALFGSAGLAGPAVVMEFINGENSGRFEVARLVARLFPAYRSYAVHVAEMDLEPATAYPTRPYPHDRLLRRGRRTIEFATPSHTAGLGTVGQLLSQEGAVQGAVTVRRRSFGMEARQVLVRLPPEMGFLAPVIVHAMEAASS